MYELCLCLPSSWCLCLFTQSSVQTRDLRYGTWRVTGVLQVCYRCVLCLKSVSSMAVLSTAENVFTCLVSFSPDNNGFVTSPRKSWCCFPHKNVDGGEKHKSIKCKQLLQPSLSLSRTPQLHSPASFPCTQTGIWGGSRRQVQRECWVM